MVCDFASLNLRTEVIPLPEFEEREEEESKKSKDGLFSIVSSLMESFFPLIPSVWEVKR